MAATLFPTLMADSEDNARAGRVPGLRFAVVKEITEQGYVLEWLSGGVRSRSAPARSASFMAGAERGGYFPFELEDEVLVGFIDGHLDQPVILGALWSDVDPPPPDADTSDSNNTRMIQSREGAQLTFDDTAGSTKTILKSAGGIEITMDDSAPSLTIKLDDSNQIVLGTDGVTVTGSTINLN